MTGKRLQNRIAGSRLALPVTVLYAALVWIVGGLLTDKLWIEFGLMIVTTYIMVELNNKNALIHTYSRMVSCSFLVLTVATGMIFHDISCCVLQLCWASFYMLVFTVYQDKQAAGRVFYAFLCIGIGSTAFIHLLFFVPVLWLLLAFNLQSFSARTFWASVLGLMMPYWFVAAYCFYQDDMQLLTDHFAALAVFQPLSDIADMPLLQVVTFAFIALLGLLGTIHFFVTRIHDKIRTRILYDLFVIIEFACIAFIILQPAHYKQLMALLTVNTAPLIAHYLALSHTRLSNIMFFVLSASAFLLTLFNLWMF